MWWLIAAGSVSAALYAAALLVPHWGRDLGRLAPIYGGLIVAYLAVSWRGVRRPGPEAEERGVLLVLWTGAVLFRVLAWMAPPTLSDDLYRYLWDGRVLLHGVNPYRYAPNAPELAFLRDALWSAINNPALPTIYPPLLVLVFGAVAAVAPTVAGWKAAVLLFDLGAGYALMRALRATGRSPALSALYLWHPLVVIEFAGNGHADAVGICLLALGLWAWTARRAGAAGLALTAAGLVKFLPWCAVPLLWPRLRWRWFLLPALIALAYLPFTLHGTNALGSLGVFTLKWRSNDFLFGFLDGAGSEAELARAKLLAAGMVAVVWGTMIALRRDGPSVYGWTAGAALLLSPVVHPWYVIWLLPPALLCGHAAWWAWSLTVFLAYAPLPGFLARGAWVESPWLKPIEMAPVLALLPFQFLAEAKRARLSRPGPSSPPPISRGA